jgi:UDP-3-O-[3-hydroxymyristoyl] glucosamine N-acyltransferase
MMTLEEIAQHTSGKIIGDKDYKIHQLSTLEEAHKGALTFFNNEKYLNKFQESEAGAYLVSEHLYKESFTKENIILVQDAYAAFLILGKFFIPKKQHQFRIDKEYSESFKSKIGVNIYIGENTHIGTDSIIYPNNYIGNNISIGKNCIIYPNVTIYDDCIIGDNVILHSGTVIGADGFGFIPDSQHNLQKVPQHGHVIIENNVEIGSNCCIDRATFGSTIIREGTKLDNLIQVGHNVEIGPHTVIAAQAGVSGSTKIGHHCQIGGQAGFVGHIQIAPYTLVNAQSGVSKSTIKEGMKLSGSPAIDFTTYYKAYSIFRRLPEKK